MKFGHNLWRNQIPEWAPNYINYKALKKLIKAAAQSLETTGDTDLAEIFFSLDRNLEDVDHFYNKKLAEYTRRLKLLHDRYGPLTHSLDEIEHDEYHDLVSALLEVRSQLRKLQWYGEVNRRGFVKILKKLDKKVPTMCTQHRYLTTKVFPTAFASNDEVTRLTKLINDHLLAVGDSKILDDNCSVTSLSSVKSANTKAIAGLLSGPIGEKLEQVLRADDQDALAALLAENPLAESVSVKLRLNILQRSISVRSRRCVAWLLSQTDSLDEEDDMNGRNCLHRLVIAIGRAKTAELEAKAVPNVATSVKARLEATKFITPAEAPKAISRTPKTAEQESVRLLSRDDDSVQFLNFVFDSLTPAQHRYLVARDSFDRTILHYAAEYGFVVICELIIEWMQRTGLASPADRFDSESWLDRDGFSPLHHAVIAGHPLTTKVLLGLDSATRATAPPSEYLDPLLVIAAKSDFIRIVRTLLDAGASSTRQDEQGECALHVAARYGRAEVARLLCDAAVAAGQSIDVPDNAFGWTPLFIAAVDGHLDVVNVFVDAGADLVRRDLSGWTAKEHATLRGHAGIMKRLAELTPVLMSLDVTAAATATPTGDATSQGNQNSKPVGPSALGDRRSRRPDLRDKPSGSVKTFGHRYLTSESMILLTLGSMDMRKKIDAVKLDEIPLSGVHATQLDTALSIVVSATEATGEPTVFDLPVQETISTEPIAFLTRDPTKVKILFDIVPTYAGVKDRIVGRGVALINSVKPSIGSNRMTLQGDVSVPIMATVDMNVIGTVNFNFLIITPFQHPKMNISEENTYWKKVENTMVIGHRGLGKNVAARSSLQLGENTIQSFVAAANLGASYVEFDVQLTKDHVPVLYHDFLVSETGIDAPVHTLTLEQFLNINEGPTSRERSPGHIEHSHSRTRDRDPSVLARPRAYSAGSRRAEASQKEAKELRMRHTRDFKKKGFKGNSRGDFIQAPFTTLEEMFDKVPQETGFNIEMKYPMLHESVEQEMDAYAVELNSFVDTVLTMVYDRAEGRQIIFSSFNPDICLLLSFKQPSIPVLFLTDAGMEEVGDVRTSSLQEAIRFASRWNLLGVVSAAEPLVTCPRLVRVIKESGLVCVTYGLMNNDPESVRLQVQEGVDAVIVDSVLAIRKGLTQGHGGGSGNGDGDGESAADTAEPVSDGDVPSDHVLAGTVAALVVSEAS